MPGVKKSAFDSDLKSVIVNKLSRRKQRGSGIKNLEYRIQKKNQGIILSAHTSNILIPAFPQVKALSYGEADPVFD